MATTAFAPGLKRSSLPRGASVGLLVICWAVMGVLFAILLAAGATTAYNVVGAIFFGTVLWAAAVWVTSRLVEGGRKATDRLVTSLVTTAFVVALLPLVSLLQTVLTNGLGRFDPLFFSSSMRNVVGAGGGALHAVVGTVEITLAAAAMSVPVGVMTAIYLVEYGRGPIARAITFLVDVMTGIPSIVAGLFAFALFVLITGLPGYRAGFGGAVALSVLMVPIVVRASEEMLKLVPMELREASYALGVPRWLTIVKIVLPTALAGIVTGVMLAIARVIGETAPLLIVSGISDSMNYNLFKERMATLPVYVYTQYATPGTDVPAYVDRAWAAALTLIVIVLLLNVIARLVSRFFAPKLASR